VSDAQVEIREVQDPDDPALPAFGRLQRKVYFEPDALIPGHYFGALLRSRSSARTNFIVVAERAGEVLGSTIFHYRAAPAPLPASWAWLARRGQHRPPPARAALRRAGSGPGLRPCRASSSTWSIPAA
jgi:hypothetical protein